jgi:surface protein
MNFQKKPLLFLPFIMLAAISVNAQAFITTWKTDNPGTSTNTQITIPTTGGGYNYNIYWEEVGNAAHNGTVNNVVGNRTIEFGTPGTYRVEITGAFPSIRFNNSGDKSKILTIEQWGNIAWTILSAAFYGCNNLTIPATDAPDLSNVTSMTSMFYGAASFNQPIDHWDVSNVTNMGRMFKDAVSFNQPLNNWNVGNVTYMYEMFDNAQSFNQPLANWNVNNVIYMQSMFRWASSFNQPLSSWQVGNVKDMSQMFRAATSFNQPLDSWDVISVEDMSEMFRFSTSFNQPINSWQVFNVENMSGMFRANPTFDQPLDNWNVGNVTNMYEMFYDATAFNQPLSNWDVSKVINMGRMFVLASSFNQSLASWDIGGVSSMLGMFAESNLSPVNYDATLQGWAIQNVKQGVSLGSTAKYCAGKAARTILINSYGWVIAGDSEDCSQVITFQELPVKTVSDPDFKVLASSSAGLPITLISSNNNVATIVDKTISIIGKGTTTITASQAGNEYYNAAISVQKTLVVKENQTLTFNALPTKKFGDTPFDLIASVSSNLPLVYSSSDENVATISGNTLTILSAGMTTITVSQPGDENFAPVSINQELLVNKADQTITFNALANKSTLDEPFELSANASSNLPVTFSSSNENVATISGSTVTIVGAGATTITAFQSGDVNYNAAPEIQQILTVKLGQTIAFYALSNKTIGGASFAVSATSSSGLPVLFSAITNNITLSGNTVSLLAPGQATLQATQTGDDIYAAALPVDQTFCINPVRPTLTVSGLGTGTTVLTSSATSGNVWYLNGVIKETTSTASHTVTQAGVYTASAIIEGCISEPSDPVALIVTEAEQPLSSLVSVYPNPVHDILNIDVTALTNTTEVSLYDVAGRLVATTSGTQRIQLNTEALALGIYLISIKNKNQVITQRISKQ